MNRARSTILCALLVVSLAHCRDSQLYVQQLPAGAVPLNASLQGGAYTLKGFEITPKKPQRAKSFTVTTYWQCARALPPGQRQFLHFESKDGQLRFVQDMDFPPQAQTTSAGKLIRLTSRVKRLPPWFVRNEMTIFTGIYRGPNRMPVDAPHDDGRSRIKLPPLSIDLNQAVTKELAIPHKDPSCAVAIDGRLSEPCWQKAFYDDAFWQTSGRAPAPQKTELRLMYDAQSMYIAFKAHDNDIHTVQTVRDAPTYDTDDVVEIFIDADGQGKRYYEMQVSAAGVSFDASFNGRRRHMHKAWDSRMRYQVLRKGTLNDGSDQDRYWQVEIALPLHVIKDAPHLPPRAGDRWRVFFYRIDRHSTRPSKGEDFHGLVPVYKGDFHMLPLMSPMRFKSP